MLQPYSLFSMGYVLIDDIWVSKFEGSSVGTPSPPRSKFSRPSTLSSSSPEIAIRLTEIDLKLDSIKDLLLDSHFYHDKIKHVNKETSTDVARLR